MNTLYPDRTADSVNAAGHSDLDNSVFVSLFWVLFLVLIMYCTSSHMLGHVTSSANGQLYTIIIYKDFLMRLLKRGEGRRIQS